MQAGGHAAAAFSQHTLPLDLPSFDVIVTHPPHACSVQLAWGLGPLATSQSVCLKLLQATWGSCHGRTGTTHCCWSSWPWGRPSRACRQHGMRVCQQLAELQEWQLLAHHR
jgi:hypothetical protein